MTTPLPNPSHDVLREQIADILDVFGHQVINKEFGGDRVTLKREPMRRIMALVDAHTEEKVREARNAMYQDLSSEASIYYEQGHTFDYEKAMKAYVTNKGKGEK